MPWPPATRSRVFAELAPLSERGRDGFCGAAGEMLPNLRSHLPLCASSAPPSAQNPAREVHVSGSAEMSCGPDRALVTVKVSSTKNSAAEAKNSVGRRLDYIVQSLQKPGIQVRGALRMAGGPQRRAPRGGDGGRRTGNGDGRGEGAERLLGGSF